MKSIMSSRTGRATAFKGTIIYRFQFRNFIPALADPWHLIAPDFPGCGYSDTPNDFAYDFDGYADFLDRFTTQLGVRRYVLYLHDFGSQIVLRLSIKSPERTVALIIQNGDIYEDELGPKYETLKEYWADPPPEGRAALAETVCEAGFREEFLNDVRGELAERISPDLWKFHWSLMTPKRCAIAVDLIAGLKENLASFPRYQAYLRASAADGHRVGATGRLRARRRGACVSAGPSGCGVPFARQRTLGAGDKLR